MLIVVYIFTRSGLSRTANMAWSGGDGRIHVGRERSMCGSCDGDYQVQPSALVGCCDFSILSFLPTLVPPSQLPLRPLQRREVFCSCFVMGPGLRMERSRRT